jgi:hypothetical protein
MPLKALISNIGTKCGSVAQILDLPKNFAGTKALAYLPRRQRQRQKVKQH